MIGNGSKVLWDTYKSNAVGVDREKLLERNAQVSEAGEQYIIPIYQFHWLS